MLKNIRTQITQIRSVNADFTLACRQSWIFYNHLILK